MKSTIIHLIGFPGTGKYTIAKEICAADESFKLVDNHLINIPLFSLIRTDGITFLPSRIWKNVELVWQAVLDTIVHISPPEYSFVLTNALFESNADDKDWVFRVENAALERGSVFVPVRVVCSVEERKKRIVRADRKARMKETDPSAPERHSSTDQVLNIRHPNLLEIDATHIPPQEAARLILDHARRIKNA